MACVVFKLGMHKGFARMESNLEICTKSWLELGLVTTLNMNHNPGVVQLAQWL